MTFFDVFSRLLTFGDLDWPRDWLFLTNCSRGSLWGTIYLPLIQWHWIRLKLDLYSGFVTSHDLWRPRDYFLRKLTSRASFWYKIYLILYQLKVWPIFRIFVPWLTSCDLATLLLLSWRKGRHFDTKFTQFQWNSKFDAEICDSAPNQNIFE